jgi:phosphatidylserine/phosphatidylglycerophosphate/cardiolipin synthase-like enzyme
VAAEASWRNGYAEDCKSFYPGSIPGEASILSIGYENSDKWKNCRQRSVSTSRSSFSRLARAAVLRRARAPIIHYAPAENLEHVDVALIDGAQHEIDVAAYVPTDWPVMQALTRAADRGVAIRIYLDGTQLAEREPAKAFLDLAETPGLDIRVKHAFA